MSSSVLAQLPPPANLSFEFDTLDREIILHWDSLGEKNAGYHLFIKEPDQSKYYLSAKIGPVYRTTYTYKVISSSGGAYSFRVAAFQNFPAVEFGFKSEAITVNVPSAFLPMVSDVTVKVKKEVAQLTWNFDHEIFDLKGFFIRINDSELLVDSTIRNYRFENMKSGVYSATITAVSTTGIRGDSSNKINFRVK